jgi:hypothetical protein
MLKFVRACMAAAVASGLLVTVVPGAVAEAVGPMITIRVSVATDGTQGDRASNQPSISGDGRYVAFSSDPENLVPGDTNFSGMFSSGTR